MKNCIKLMRVHHYIKNLLVFAALACSGQLLDPQKLIAALFAFAAFCAVSSCIYIFNDIRDREKDRKHPKKCLRPIAAGTVSVKAAVILAVILLVIAGICNYFVFMPWSSLLLLLYFVANLAYSIGLKNVPILDIAILVSGFLIRVLYGAQVTGIVVSNWLYLTVLAISFYLSFGKRRNELKLSCDGQTREVLKKYPLSFLDKSMGMCLTLTNVFYALWSMDEKTVALYGNTVVFTVPVVLLITLKYNLTVEGDSDGDPVEVLLHDKILLLLCLFYFAMMFVILYR